MDDFVFHRPVSLDEACALSRELGDGALFIAGGTDIVTDLKSGRRSARHLISLSALEELRGIRREGDLVRIGALTSHQQVAESADVREAFPGLAEAAGMLGAAQIRNQGTIGGNFCAAVPCADTPPISLVGQVRLRLIDGDSEREVAAEKFFLGPRKCVLKPGEILAELLVPCQGADSGASYQRFTLRGGLALSVASAAAGVRMEKGKVSRVRVCLGAVAPVPLLVDECSTLLEGNQPSPALIERAGEAAAKAAQPITDIRGSEAYRREIITVMTQRALATALERAQGRRTYPWERER